MKINIKIYGKPNCQWCTAAISLLDRKKIAYEYHDLFEMKQVDARNVIDWSGMKTVPIIYIDNICIGGFDALDGYLRGKEQEWA